MKIVVLRFSALGDVALLVPVLQKLKQSYPETEITMVSRGFLQPLFQPLGINFHAADLNGKHKGFFGLGKLAREIKKQYQPDLVFDQHAVLRTHILKLHFKALGVKFVQLQKDRAGRKQLTTYPNKVLEPLPHVTEKYRQTFARGGMNFSFNRKSEHQVAYAMAAETEAFWEKEKAAINLGVAPFAMHRAKRWPLEKMKAFLQSLQNESLKIWLFGGLDEKAELQKLGEASGKAFVVAAGCFKLDQEIDLMRNLKGMVAMDSSNMHLATLAGIPVVSIWGGTHPYAGFAPLGDNEKYMVQLGSDELDCRPCSAFGAKACFRGDYACMEWLEVERVKKVVDQVLGSGN